MLSYKDAVSLFDYNKVTGKLCWKHDTSSIVDIKEIDTTSLVFLYHYGVMPFYTIMYKDNDSTNTKIENLVDVDTEFKGGGIKGKGFSKHNDKLWKAVFTRAGRTIHLGYHSTELDAALARLTFECQCPLVDCLFVNPVVCWIAAAHPEINLKAINGIIWPATGRNTE